MGKCTGAPRPPHLERLLDVSQAAGATCSPAHPLQYAGYGVYTYPNSFFRYEGEWKGGKTHGKKRWWPLPAAATLQPAAPFLRALGKRVAPGARGPGPPTVTVAQERHWGSLGTLPWC